jgi:hemerythrin
MFTVEVDKARDGGSEMLVEWQESLSVGVLEIDLQHKLLFEKFNAFLEACEANTEADGIYRLFWFLEAYTLTHFAEEEKLMRKVAYPDFEKHQGQHQAFAAQITDLKQRLRSEGPTDSLVSHMREFISDWLIGHISHMDRALAVFVTAAGIPAI